MTHRIMFSICSLAALFISGSVKAYDWNISAHVTSVELSYTPSNIDFKIDQAGGACAAGALLNWVPSHHTSDAQSASQNASSIISLLLSAEITGHTITLYGSNSGCEINNIYIN